MERKPYQNSEIFRIALRRPYILDEMLADETSLLWAYAHEQEEVITPVKGYPLLYIDQIVLAALTQMGLPIVHTENGPHIYGLDTGMSKNDANLHGSWETTVSVGGVALVTAKKNTQAGSVWIPLPPTQRFFFGGKGNRGIVGPVDMTLDGIPEVLRSKGFDPESVVMQTFLSANPDDMPNISHMLQNMLFPDPAVILRNRIKAFSLLAELPNFAS